MPPNVNVTTTTNQYLAPFWVDRILRDNYFFGKVLGNTKKWDGSQMLFPMKYQKGVATVAFNGFDLLPITQQPVSVNMTFYPTFVATNLALAGSDISVNNTPMQTLKLVDVMMESRAQDAADDMGNFLQGDGTSFGGKAPSGLANTVDNGTVAPTYGGLSRATYSGLNATVTASGGTISLVKVRTLWNNISDGGVIPEQGGEEQYGGPVEEHMSPSGGARTDDVPARLNEGEFVIPDDVVSWFGEKHFYGLIDKTAKEREEMKHKTGAIPEEGVAPVEEPQFQSA